MRYMRDMKREKYTEHFINSYNETRHDRQLCKYIYKLIKIVVVQYFLD